MVALFMWGHTVLGINSKEKAFDIFWFRYLLGKHVTMETLHVKRHCLVKYDSNVTIYV